MDRDWDGNPDMLHRLRQFGARSLIVVPLRAQNDRILGTLTFGSTRSDRFHSHADLLSEEYDPRARRTLGNFPQAFGRASVSREGDGRKLPEPRHDTHRPAHARQKGES